MLMGLDLLGDTYFNGSYCNDSIKGELAHLLLVFCISGAVCAFLCFLTIIVMIFCRLFTLLTHRLIIYMLLGIFFYSFIVAAQCMNYWLNIWKGEHAVVCIVESYFTEYACWVMLLSVLMVTLHLTVMVLFPKFHIKMGRLEPFYILFPWLFPLLVAWIPFVHNNYGISGSWCWIRLYNNNCSLNKEGMIEMYAVLYGELFVGLILNNIALIIIFVTLCKRVYCNTTCPNYRKTLKQTLPLVIYPISYQLFTWFAIANRLNQALNKGSGGTWLFYMHAFFGASGGFFAPLLSLLYILFLRKTIKDNIRKWHCLKCFFGPKTESEATDTSRLINPDQPERASSTNTNQPRESEIEREYEIIN
uniref:G-protein coupled receptors family 2 profile 2 domain-containing protein n=1 Tax=Amphimedon queenslandica TaxID=400682 RepID=A0A1X7VPH2_AMPQE